MEESPSPALSPVLRVLQSKAETRAFYDKISGVYDLLAEQTEAPVRQRGLEQLAPAPGDSVLEIGCGTGHCLVDLARRVGTVGQVCGVDLSLGMLAQSAKTVGEQGVTDRVRLACADAERLCLRSATMDDIFMSFTLELFDTPRIPQVLDECHRVLRSGGRLVVVGVSKEARPGLALGAFEWTHRHFPNLLDCRPIYVRRSIESAGFVIEHAVVERLWVPVEVVAAVKGAGSARPGGAR